MTAQQYIQLAANSYFWVFVVTFVINWLYTKTDQYEQDVETRRRLGNVGIGLPFSTTIAWTLFVISIQLR